MSVEFDDQLVYVLSSLRHIQQHVPPVPSLSRDQKKHLNMLDGIALLLVTEGKGDVAAVSFLHSSTSIEFYYAKNRSCTSQETAYVQKLLEMAKTLKPSESSEWVARALELVIQMCIKKVKGRMRKVTNEMRKCGISSPLSAEDIHNLPIWCETNRKGEFPKAYKRAFPSAQSVERLSDKDIFLRYFNGLLWISGPEGQTKDIKMAVWLSRHMGFALRIAPILSNPTLIRRIQKLGDYADAVQTLAAMVLDPTIYKLKDTIKFIEVKPCEQTIHRMPKDFVQVLNNYAVGIGEPQVQWEDLCDAFPSLKDRAKPEDGDMKVTASVHCECTIATYLWKNAVVRPNAFEIGVSKRCCWLCQKYLEFLVEPGDSSVLASTPKFLVSGYQGKIHSGWHPPPWPTRPIGRMVALLNSEIGEILGSIIRTNRSDSFPRSPVFESGEISMKDSVDDAFNRTFK